MSGNNQDLATTTELKEYYSNPLGSIRVTKYRSIHELFHAMKTIFFTTQILNLLQITSNKEPNEYAPSTKNKKLLEIFKKVFPDFSKWENEYVTKDKLQIKKFIETLILLKMNYTPEYLKSTFSYFRYQKIQSLYKECLWIKITQKQQKLKINYDENEESLVQKFASQSTKEDFSKSTNTDHILSSKIFQEIVFAFFLDSNYSYVEWSYDYINTLRTTINQCWNLRLLAEGENKKKGVLEAKICGILRNLNETRTSVLKYNFTDKDVIEYFTTVAKRMDTFCMKGKDFFGAVKSFRDYFFKFLEKFGVNLSDYYDGNGNHQKRTRCQCVVCIYCRENSSRWRFKYFLIFVHSDDEKLPFDKIHTFFQKVKELYNESKITFD